MSLNLAAAPQSLDEAAALEDSLVLPRFTADDAWTLGTILRDVLRHSQTACVVNIALANSQQLLFHTATRPGTMPDNDTWVARKRNTVLRWGRSSWYMHVKYGGDEARFNARMGADGPKYAIHGGGVPVRVQGVEGVVAVVVVSGLQQEEDHMVVVQALQKLQQSLQ